MTNTDVPQTSEQEIHVIWLCRGCRAPVEADIHPSEDVVKCPHCGTERHRHTFSEFQK